MRAFEERGTLIDPKEPLIMRTVRQQPALSSLKLTSWPPPLGCIALRERNARSASFCP
jgi:hypothetical protein